MAWQAAAAKMGGDIVGGIFGSKAAREQAFKQRQHERDMGYAAMSLFDNDEIQGRFNFINNLLGGSFNQMAASNALAGQTAAGALQAGLSRAGLGGTGLGAALGAGARAGATFQTNNLRARLNQEALASAIGVQGQAASALLGGLQAGAGTAGRFGANQSALYGGAAGFGAGAEAGYLDTLLNSLFD